MATHVKITKTLARKVLTVVDAGLVAGVGNPNPGEMCVEAAVCFALGEPHGDEPSCVSPALRSFKITLNDAGWSSPTARAAGLRRIAIAQLGTADTLDDVEFARRVAMLSVCSIVPRALRLAATMKMPKQHSEALQKAARDCEAAQDLDAASYAARAASYATASDKELSIVAEAVVQILIEMKTPGRARQFRSAHCPTQQGTLWRPVGGRTGTARGRTDRRRQRNGRGRVPQQRRSACGSCGAQQPQLGRRRSARCRSRSPDQ